MQFDTGADSTVISFFIWIELGKVLLIGKPRRPEAYDGYQLTVLEQLTCDVELNGNKYITTTTCRWAIQQKVWTTWEGHITPRRHYYIV